MNLEQKINDSVMYSVWGSVDKSVWDSVEDSVSVSIMDSVRIRVWHSVYNSADSVNSVVRDTVNNKLKTYDFTTKNK